MNQITEHDLILHLYGESPRREEIEKALAADGTLASQYAELRSVLQTVDEHDTVPSLPSDYEARVWQRLQWKLDAPEANSPWWKRWFSMQVLLPASAVAALVLVAFVVGRWGPGANQAPELNQAVRERILLVDMSQHLGNAEMVLVEVMNAGDGAGEMRAVRERAGDLLSSNRLYRQVTSEGTEDPAMRSVLDELDRVLIELRNSPDGTSGEAIASLQESLRQNGTLFKVRVLRTRMQKEAKSFQPGTATI